jgi:hypothetical protein
MANADWSAPQPNPTPSAVALLHVLGRGKSLTDIPSDIPENISGQLGGIWSEDTDNSGGWLRGIRDGDTLVATLHSPQFALALKHSGRKLKDVLPEIHVATLPQRGAYFDSANGSLAKIRKRLGLHVYDYMN